MGFAMDQPGQEAFLSKTAANHTGFRGGIQIEKFKVIYIGAAPCVCPELRT
jgi:hypothetical protein